MEIERFELGSPRLREFVEYPWRLHAGDECWSPPLRADLLGSRLLGVKGLLTSQHPYHQSAEVTHFLATVEGRTVGRISAAVNQRFNEHYGSQIGFFGFFDCVDDADVAGELIAAASEWCRERGMTTLRGPGEYSNATHERQGVLIDGFDTPPTVELTHNPPYYARLLETAGLHKVMDYHAHLLDITAPEPPALRRAASWVRNRGSITTRPVEPERFQDDVRLVVQIYNEAWAANWGHLPLSEAEADVLADTLKPILDPGLVRFAYVDGEPAAVLGAFPDPNWALKPRWRWYGDSDLVRIFRLLRERRRIERVRLMFFGIVPKYRKLGVDAVLFEEVLDHARDHGYRQCDISMLLETNDMVIRAAEHMGGRRYKTWRIYEKALH